MTTEDKALADGYDVAGSDWYEQGVAATPALALTAAALLARGEQS